MSDRFADCETTARVLWTYRTRAEKLIDADAGVNERTALVADALARIAELTPPKDENLRDHAEHILRVHGLLNPTPRTVTTEQRERVRKLVSGWVDGMQCHAVTDRIIEALGWTAPATELEADPDADLKLKPGEVPPESKPSPSFTAIYGGTEPGVPAIALPTEMDGTGARIGGDQ